MRFALVTVFCSLVCVAAAGGELEARKTFSLFDEKREPLLTVSGYVWYSQGTSTSVGVGEVRLKSDQNYVGIIEGRLYFPGLPWVGVHARFGKTLSDSDGETGGAVEEDCEADFTLTEINGLVTLAGRHSPLTPEHGLPGSYLDAFVGVRIFNEEFECDGSLDYEATWVGVQLGLRGEWAMVDTYGKESPFRCLSLSGELALLPWVTVDSEFKYSGDKFFEGDSSEAYGLAGAIALNYRYRFMKFTVGYMWQRMRADDGDAESFGSDFDLPYVTSSRQGVFAGASVRF